MFYPMQEVSTFFTRILKPFLWGFVGFLLMIETKATEAILSDPTTLSNRIEFAFVLLPESSISEEIYGVAQKVGNILGPLQQQLLDPIWGEDCNKVVRIPHVSIGQYGLLGIELNSLFSMVSEIAQQFEPLTEPMSSIPFVTKENIFMDCLNIREKTNQVIVDLYTKLRERFMADIQTRFPITQALLERFSNREKPKEIMLLDQCYQNWGTPEDSRIRPHFTLFYNHAASEVDCNKALEKFIA